MFLRTLTHAAAIALVAGAAAGQEPALTPVPEGETARTIIERVIATERAEARGGPAYIVVRERTAMTPVPGLVVLKKVPGLGYFHLPPAGIPTEIERGGGPGPGLEPEEKYLGLVAMTLGAAVIAELHAPGTGGPVTRAGIEMLTSMEAAEARAAAEIWFADQDLRARFAAMRRLVEKLELIGLGEVDGQEIWYLRADDLGFRLRNSAMGVGGAAASDAFEGDVIFEKAEIWVSRALNRIVALSFEGRGAEGAFYRMTPPAEMPFYHGDTERDRFLVRVKGFRVQQTRRDFRAVEGTGVLLPRRKINHVSINLAGDDEMIEELISQMRRTARDWNENVAFFESILIRRQEELDRQGSDAKAELTAEERAGWERVKKEYEDYILPREALLRIMANPEPIEGGIVVEVECAVPAPAAGTLAATLATMGQGAITPTDCG